MTPESPEPPKQQTRLLELIAAGLRGAISRRDQTTMQAVLEVIDWYADVLAPALVATIPAAGKNEKTRRASLRPGESE